MGKLETLKIVYSTQPPLFFPGQVISGFVNVVLNEPMEMRNIKLKVEGKAYVMYI